jgi:hypothetical protein
MPSPLAWNKTAVTATGQVLGQGVEFGGAFLSVAGTSTTLTAYDNTSAAGNPVIPVSATLTVGQFVPPNGGLPVGAALPAEGVMLTTGLYVTVGGTGSPVFYVLWR